MSVVRTHTRLLAASALAGTILLIGMTLQAMGQDRRSWVDPPPQQAPSPPQPEIPQPIPLDPEPTTPFPAKRSDFARQTAVSGPAAQSPAAKAARVAPSDRQRLRTDRVIAPAPRTRSASSPQPAPVVQTAGRAQTAQQERSLVAVTPRPSFNCSFAQTPVEQVICTDPVLAAKDMRMALLYEQRGGSRYRPVDERQWRWLAAREACGRMPRVVLEACVGRTYDARIAELSTAR